MSADQIDPEVAADIALRESTAASRPRMSDEAFAAGLAQAAKPKIVDRVPCRARCGNVVDWTEEAEQAFNTFCGELARRDEWPLDKTKIAFCNGCRAEGAKIRADENRKFVDKVAEAIRQLKDGCSPDRERELLAKLERAGHPDIAGLKQWLKDQAAKGKRGQSKGDF